MKINHLLLDADGVFQRYPPIVAWIAHRVQCDQGGIELLIRQILAAEADPLRGVGDFADFLQPVFSYWRINGTPEDFLDYWHPPIVSEGILACLPKLRSQGIRVSIASNQEERRANRMAVKCQYNERFDFQFYSCNIGHAKPSQRFFEHVVSTLNAPPSDILFIDDLEMNLTVAKACGMHVAQFNLPNVGDAVPEFLEVLKIAGLQI